jgi:hypothetical protein
MFVFAATAKKASRKLQSSPAYQKACSPAGAGFAMLLALCGLIKYALTAGYRPESRKEGLTVLAATRP